MRLNKVQKKFSDIMLDRENVIEAPPGDFLALFAAGEIPLSERLKVYRNNIVGSLSEALRMNFSAVEDLTGKEFFTAMARNFILSSPPHEGDINEYGAGFDEFIASYTPAKGLPYLADVARLEIAVNAAYFAPDDAAMTAAELSPENLHLQLRRSAQLVESKFPVSAIRRFCLNKNRGADEVLDISGGGEKLLVLRPELKIMIIELNDAEYDFLKSIAGGVETATALEETLGRHPNFDFARFLQSHIALGSFAA